MWAASGSLCGPTANPGLDTASHRDPYLAADCASDGCPDSGANGTADTPANGEAHAEASWKPHSPAHTPTNYSTYRGADC